MKTKAAIFLNGTYPTEQQEFYINECLNNRADSIIIVTDGGLKFFIDNKLKPDVIVGDMDSIDRKTLDFYDEAKVITVAPQGKSLTDGELALDWCANNKVAEVTLFGGIDTAFATDHLMGNIFMMFAFKDKFTSIKMRDYCQEIIPLENESCSGEGKPGDMLSVIPLSDEIVYKASGLKYDPGGKTFSFGQTEPLRNELANTTFKVNIKGRAVVVRYF